MELTGDSLTDYREQHPLHAVMPVVRQLLVGPAAADDLIVAVSDADGTLLWVEGASAARGRAEQMRFTEGARWDERHAGTNAPGLALAVDRGVHVQAAEHWARPVR
nr:transcriptional regulator [Micromonospora sp. DSM 115978]